MVTQPGAAVTETQPSTGFRKRNDPHPRQRRREAPLPAPPHDDFVIVEPKRRGHWQLKDEIVERPPEVDGSLSAVEDHGDDDAEFIVQAPRVRGFPEDGTLTQTIKLVAIDADGDQTVVASLQVGDKIRLRVDRDEVKAEVADGDDLVDNEFQIRAEAESFKVVYSVTDSGGLTDQDEVTVDLIVTERIIHEAETDVSDQPIVIN